jgi:hypothetical protein
MLKILRHDFIKANKHANFAEPAHKRQKDGNSDPVAKVPGSDERPLGGCLPPDVDGESQDDPCCTMPIVFSQNDAEQTRLTTNAQPAAFGSQSTVRVTQMFKSILVGPERSTVQSAPGFQGQASCTLDEPPLERCESETATAAVHTWRPTRSCWPMPFKPADSEAEADVASCRAADKTIGTQPAPVEVQGLLEGVTRVSFPSTATPLNTSSLAAGSPSAALAGMATPEISVSASGQRSVQSGTVRDTTGSLSSGADVGAAHSADLLATPIPFKGFDVGVAPLHMPRATAAADSGMARTNHTQVGRSACGGLVVLKGGGGTALQVGSARSLWQVIDHETPGINGPENTAGTSVVSFTPKSMLELHKQADSLLLCREEASTVRTLARSRLRFPCFPAIHAAHAQSLTCMPIWSIHN